ncbi:protein trichome birefringence-like 19 [Camellia sinensis]|uniref:Uncharacterized protein n=1 Tax=Camellia sinensis var. sinensis TaxID=542762 RepID=A0A4S4DP26_CAMSN|nr:protein trichome birefringence-like 19 [Camellia sinensis]THG04800.1 hypothetical protein TEA_001732 [Camellia sinensis var. sinensis]
MKFKAIEFPSISKNIVLPILTLLLLTTIPLCYIYDTSPSLLPSLEIINNNGSNSIPIHSKNNPSSSLPSLEIIDNNGSIPIQLTNNPYSPLTSLEIINNDGSTPIHQKNNTSSPLQSLEIINNNGSNSIPIHQKNNPSSPLQPLEIINNNGSIPTHQTNNPSSPLQSLEIINNNGSTPIHPKNNPSSPLQSLEIIDNNGSIPIQSENNSPSPLQSLHIDTSVTIPTNDSKNPLWPLKVNNGSDNPLSSSLQTSSQIVTNASTSVGFEQGCDIFKGNWVPYPKGPYYTNETKCVIDDRQNCMKYGRPDNDFLKWRWKPDECELPPFDAVKFLEIVRGKSLAFVGDSVGRNQMQSLVCLLASATNPVDVSYTPDTRFRRWLYIDYNFTIIALWSPLLVKSEETNPQGILMNLYLDEPDSAWTSQIKNVDIVILSGGQWFFRPFMYYEKGKIIGCYACNKKNVTDLIIFYGYKRAFRTAFRTLLGLHNFKGIVFLRAFSPSHYEQGEWNNGGRCERTRPFTKQQVRSDWYNLEMYNTQVKELKAAERRGRKKGLRFRLLDTTKAMMMRPDGHPNHYGHWPEENKTIADCVHWCMPGPIDTWNEFLIQMLKMEK